MKKQAGISMIEILLVLAAVGFLILIIANLPPAASTITRNRHISEARDIANRQLEYLRKQGYANLTEGTFSFIDPSLNNLKNGTGEVEIGECPADVCTLGEQAKQISVKVSWQEVNEDKQVKLTTLISEGGIGQ